MKATDFIVPITVSRRFDWEPKLKATNDIFIWSHTLMNTSICMGFWYGRLRHSSQN